MRALASIPGGAPAAGLADPVHDAQRAFRAALDALARPGRPVKLGAPLAGLTLRCAMAHLLLTLTDDESVVWWQPSGPPAAGWLRFHTGARATGETAAAQFAVLTDVAELPPLTHFGQGTAAAPEFSTTLLIEVPSLDAGPALQWQGPGIRGSSAVRIAGLPPLFWPQWRANHASFPQGVDVFFTCADRAIGLPRTTRVARLEGI